MVETKKSKAPYWALFLVSLTALILLLLFAPQWVWTALPGTFTGIVALNDWA